MSNSDTRVLNTQYPSLIQTEQWKILVNNSDIHRSQNLAWRKWYHSQKVATACGVNNSNTTIKPVDAIKRMNSTIFSTTMGHKFYVVDDEYDELVKDDDEDDEDDDEIDKWYVDDGSDDDELLFEKSRDNSSSNSVYHISPSLSTQKQKPVSLLTTMLQQQQQSDNKNKQKLPQIAQQSQQLLRRCQSKYKSLNEWFLNAANTTTKTTFLQ